MTFAICLANRGTFPGSLFDTARKELVKALAAQGHTALLLPKGSTRHDAVGSPKEGRVYAKFLAAKGIRPLADAPRGVDVASREKDGKEFVFLMNFTDESKTVSVNGTNVMSGEKAASGTLPSLGWAVIER